MLMDEINVSEWFRTNLPLLQDAKREIWTFPTWHVAYNQKFSRESNFPYFRERFENAKICLREKLYF